jgi:hypothetical protein
MSGAIPSFPQYAFMAWKCTLYLRFYDFSNCQVFEWSSVNAQEKPYSIYTTGSYKAEQSGEIEALFAAASNVPTALAL